MFDKIIKRGMDGKKLHNHGCSITPFLHTLPIGVIFRIFDYLSDFTLLCSMQSVCARLNGTQDIKYDVFLTNDLMMYLINLWQNLVHNTHGSDFIAIGISEL